MVKKTNNVRKEQFDLLKDEIAFWDTAIQSSKEALQHAKAAKNHNVRRLLKLQKKYSEKNILQD